jgi:tetratricopeptide (TPR) repeat protein
MRLMLGLLVAAGIPALAAAQDDPLVGSIVFPRVPGVELRTQDGMKLGPWGATPVRVVKVTPSGQVRGHSLYPPGSGEYWTRRAEVVKLADAVAHFSDHIRDHPADPWGYELRAAAYYELRQHDKGVADLTEAIRLGPTAHSYSLRGAHWASRGDDARAVEDFTAALRLDPENYYALTQRGCAHTRAREFARAEADFAKAIQLRPSDPVAFNYRGLMWDARDEFDKALADFTEAIRLHGAYAEAFANRGYTRSAKRDNATAVDDFTQAIRLDPTNGQYHYARGFAYGALREYDKAVVDFTEAGRLNPADSRPYLRRGDVRRLQKNTDPAIADYTEAIRRDPKSHEAFSGRAVMWERKGEYGKSIADYSEAIRLNSKGQAPYNALAWLLATCPDAKYRDGVKAVELATRLCDLSMGSVADHLDTLAAAYAEGGNFDKAVETQKKALAIPGTGEGDARDYRERLKLYEAGRPYRQQPQAKKD